jgi:hypothetical protein
METIKQMFHITQSHLPRDTDQIVFIFLGNWVEEQFHQPQKQISVLHLLVLMEPLNIQNTIRFDEFCESMSPSWMCKEQRPTNNFYHEHQNVVNQRTDKSRVI